MSAWKGLRGSSKLWTRRGRVPDLERAIIAKRDRFTKGVDEGASYLRRQLRRSAPQLPSKR